MSTYKGIGKGKKCSGRQSDSSKAKDAIIPHAPIGRRFATAADKDLDKWREVLNKDFPFMSPEQIARAEQPLHMMLLHDMINQGDSAAATELHNLLKKEERERIVNRKTVKHPLLQQPEKLKRLAESLAICHNLLDQGKLEAELVFRKELAEEALHDGDIWLSKHFFLSCISGLKKLKEGGGGGKKGGTGENNLRKMEAEIHCLLAFLAKETNETLETALAIAIEHLSLCRNLSHDQPWQFKPKVLEIKLKKPIAIHGLRVDEKEIYDIVDGCSMTIYMIATLLEHEFLISLANQIMHSHHAPTEEDVKVAHEFADHALKLALEVRQPTAMSSALVRFGLVLRHSGAHEDALTYFEHLQQHAVSTSDYMTEAIAYHNIGLCLIGSHKSGDALEVFAKQMDIATDYHLKDLEADAMYEVGHLLLQEGHLWEAEECYAIAFENFKKMAHTHSHGQAAWSMLGIAAGHKLWGRFASLCRHNRNSDFITLLDWKCSRRTISSNNRPPYKPQLIAKVFNPLAKKMKVGLMTQSVTVSPNYEEMVDSLELFSDNMRLERKQELVPELKPLVTGQLGQGQGQGQEEEDYERTELDVSISQLDTQTQQNSEELLGYERLSTKRVSSSPMIDPQTLLVQQMLDKQRELDGDKFNPQISTSDSEDETTDTDYDTEEDEEDEEDEEEEDENEADEEDVDRKGSLYRPSELGIGESFMLRPTWIGERESHLFIGDLQPRPSDFVDAPRPSEAEGPRPSEMPAEKIAAFNQALEESKQVTQLDQVQVTKQSIVVDPDQQPSPQDDQITQPQVQEASQVVDQDDKTKPKPGESQSETVQRK